MSGTPPYRVVRLAACSSFKLAIVLGSSRVPGKLRVQTYSHASRGWSHPHTIVETDVSDPAFAEMTPGQRRTLAHATLDIAKSNLGSTSGVPA